MRILDREIRMFEGMLQCPRCTDHYLHQSDVMVFNRKEDANKVHLTSVTKNEPMVIVADVDNDTSLNPSARRQGLTIDFQCESCDGDGDSKVTLAIYQHKGSTYLDWRQN
jgi:hypothetical protein